MHARKCGKETPEKESKKCLLLAPSLLHSWRAILAHGRDLTNEPSCSPMRASQDGLSSTIGSNGFKWTGRYKDSLRPKDYKGGKNDDGAWQRRNLTQLVEECKKHAPWW